METFAFLVYQNKINNKKLPLGMKVNNFAQFVKSIQTNENSDLDWSDKNWDESGVDGVNPPNSGFEGTSAEKMDYTAGDYGETGEDDTYTDGKEHDPVKIKEGMENIKAMIDDLTERINMLQKNKKN
jgi:hypothetical protein